MDAPGFRDLSPYAQVLLGVCGLSVVYAALALCVCAAAALRRLIGQKQARSALHATPARPPASKRCSHTLHCKLMIIGELLLWPTWQSCV